MQASASSPIPAYDLAPAEWRAVCTAAGQPAYRAGQICRWLYREGVARWDAMTDLPAAFRADLAARFTLDVAVAERVEAARDAQGTTRKLLIGLRDGERVEAVWIPAGRRRTVCVSSQAGCAFRCAFCASGQAGFRRNLEAGEMTAQVLAARRAGGERVTHVVFMGVGEPLDNYDAVLKAVRIMNARDGLGIGARHITLSTCGVVPGIARLAEEGLQVELSVSLHAPDDALRSRLMPVNRRYPLDALIPACEAYARRTGRIVTFEYTLIRDLNDTPAHASQLALRLRPLPCRVNLIPLSPVAEFDGRPPARGTPGRFAAALKAGGVHATVRRSRGCARHAACGQLRWRPRGGAEAA
ncbi:MAG: 23S rRNA (adenine(2503)-C(2))-methyltransferase RlmN [Lentisphaerae bacterium]|nr:23S rRNA (adenine(2503)-C(2))-methyltransferase RlmN [Lentisphaerota bacterium]